MPRACGSPEVDCDGFYIGSAFRVGNVADCGLRARGSSYATTSLHADLGLEASGTIAESSSLLVRVGLLVDARHVPLVRR